MLTVDGKMIGIVVEETNSAIVKPLIVETAVISVTLRLTEFIPLACNEDVNN